MNTYLNIVLIVEQRCKRKMTKSELIRFLEPYKRTMFGDPKYGEVSVAEIIEALEGQRTGKWIIEHTGNGWNDWDNITCDRCGFSLIKVSELRDLHFCPHCGAKMVVENE